MGYQLSIKSRLFGTSCALALAVSSGAATAQEIDIQDGVYTVGINQTFNGFQNNTASISSTTGDVTDTREVEVGFSVNDEVADSDLEVGGTEGNIASASLTVNLAETALDSDVNNDDFETAGATANAGTFLDSPTGRDRAEAGSVDADMSISTAQNVNDTEADVQSASNIGTFSTNVSDSTITVSNNVQEGVGLLNRNTTTLTSTANASDASMSVATSQNVTASSLDVTTDSLADVEVDGAGNDSTLELTGNTQRAVAAGNVGVNTIDSDANDLEIIVSGPNSTTIDLTNPDAPSSVATAGSVIASSQIVDLSDAASEPLTSTVDGTGAGFEASVTGDVSDSTVVNEDNAANALIIGNEVANEISLSSNSIETGVIDSTDGFVATPGAAAAVSSLQIFDGDATATAFAEAEQGVRTLIGNNVGDASVSTSENNIEATAIGNTGANRVIADANFIDTSAEGAGSGAIASALTGLTGTVTTTGAGFELSSAQTADGSITATLTDESVNPVTAASVATDIGGNITNSTVQSDDNTLQARAVGNEITEQTNEISVSGANVATTTALANFQGLQADVSAVVGSPGTPFIPGTPDEPFELTGTLNNNVITGSGINDLSQEEVDVLETEFGTDLNINGDDFTIINQGSGSGPITLNQNDGLLVPGTNSTPASPGAGGVTVASGGTITNSTITVDGNTTQGSVTGNVATNSIEVSATNLDPGSALTSSTAAGDTAPSTTSSIGVAEAENALANTQTIDGSELSTDVAATFGVISDLDTYDTTDSTLSVSDNEQFATTRGNDVSNSIDLSATNMETGAAISSLQTGGDTSVTADSVMDVSAPAAMSGSTLGLNNNRNEAEATVNTAENTLDVTPTNIVSISGGVNVDLLSSLTVDNTATPVIQNLAEADFALASGQAASGTVSAEATSRVINQDMPGDTPFATTGIENSSVTVDGNVTLAIGSANRAINNMMLDAGASSAATGAVLNLQTSSSSVTSNVDATAGIDLLSDGTTASALDASSASVSNNAASAQARGNVSSNVLNASAVSLGGVGSGPASVNLQSGNAADGGVSATFGVLNNQVNSGLIEATATAQYGGNLGNQDGSAVQNSQSSVSGNVIQATAVANTATNTMTLSALNHSSSGAIGNEQNNSGNVTSLVSGSRIGVSTNGSVQSSTMSAGGNTISSSAIGNRAISSISRN